MKNERNYKDFLNDIIVAIENIENFIKDTDYASFEKNLQKVYATTHCLEIIGEAVKKIPENVKGKYDDIPWRKIAGMRDILIHGYFVVDSKKIWETVNRDLSPLKRTVDKMLNDL